MPSTTNFGWTTPADTDSVKDGASAIRTLGNGIDASLLDLKGGTTGQVLSKNSNTDLDFTWVTSDDANAIQNAIVDAKGDLITATAADTPARLAVGTDGQYLTADSTTATGLKWSSASAGGLTLLSTTTLSGTSTTISSISGSYKNLMLIVDNLIDNGTGDTVFLRFNSDSGTNYWWNGYYSRDDNGTIGLVNYTSGRAGSTRANIIYLTGTGDNNKNKGRAVINLYRYTTTGGVFFDVDSNSQKSNTWTQSQHTGGVYNNSAAITSITVGIASGTIDGGTAYLYGVN